MAEMFTKHGELDAGMIIRRALFLLLLIGLGIYHLFVTFRGLTHERGIDQAQIAREIALEEKFNTKFLRPLTIFQVNKVRGDREPVVPTNFADVSHAPLNPLLNSAVFRFFRLFNGNDEQSWIYDPDSGSSVFVLDRLIATVSIILFFASIFVSYLLVSRIFDTKIAGVTCLMLLMSSLMWDFTHSGLPQMLMLFLFSFALYFLFKAVEMQREGTPPYVWIALAAGFFGLLALTHWLAIWLLFGLLLFSAFYFQPRGAMAFVLLVIFTAIVAAWAVRNDKLCGNYFGTGFFSLQAGLAGGDVSDVFRTYNLEQEDYTMEGLPTKIIVNSLQQLQELYQFLGSIVVAPLFFLSLLHPFKRAEIAHFRWCILSMWIFAVLGMTIYGLPEGVYDPNQLHILFSPIMAAYGLAFLTVVWNRIGFESNHPLATQGHLILVSLITAIPLLLPLPKQLKSGLALGKMQRAVLPDYFPPYISTLNEWTTESEIVFSDIPWAVAWYGNRTSIWLPKKWESVQELTDYVEKTGKTFSGVFLSPRTLNARLMADVTDGKYAAWREPILNARLSAEDLGYELLPDDFPFPELMRMNGFYFYSDRRRWFETK